MYNTLLTIVILLPSFHTEVGLVNHLVLLFWSFWGIFILIFRIFSTSLHFISDAPRWHFSMSSLTLVISDARHPHRYNVLSNRDLIFSSLLINDSGHGFSYTCSVLFVFTRKLLFKSLHICDINLLSDISLENLFCYSAMWTIGFISSLFSAHLVLYLFLWQYHTVLTYGLNLCFPPALWSVLK